MDSSTGNAQMLSTTANLDNSQMNDFSLIDTEASSKV